MHQDANTGHGLCTLYGCRVVVFAVGSRRSAATRSRRPSCARRPGSSGSPTPALKRPRRSGSAALPSTGGSFRTSKPSTCRGGRSWSRWTSSSGSSPSGVDLGASAYLRPDRPAAPPPSCTTSQSASTPNAPPARALPRSPATSTPAARRLPTAVDSGGRRRCAPSSSEPPDAEGGAPMTSPDRIRCHRSTASAHPPPGGGEELTTREDRSTGDVRDDVGDPCRSKASGEVELPLDIRWSARRSPMT
jgi:hypothetical protein